MPFYDVTTEYLVPADLDPYALSTDVDAAAQNIRSHFHIPTNAIDVAPRTVNSNANMARDTVFLTYFTPITTLTVSQVTMAVAGQNLSGSTGAQMGVYTVDNSGNLALVAETASDSTLFNATFTNFTRSFSNSRGLPTSYELKAGVRYAAAMIHHASTVPAIYHAHAFVPNNLNILEPRMMARKTGETGLLPLSITSASLTTTTSDPWARFS